MCACACCGRKGAVMFQDIAPKEFCNDFAWVDPEPTDRVLIYRGSSVLVACEGDTLRFPSYRELRDVGVVGLHAVEPVCAGGAAESHAGSAANVQPSDVRSTNVRSPLAQPFAERSVGLLPTRIDGVQPQALFLFTVGETAYFRCEIDEATLTSFAVDPWRFMPIGTLHQHGPRHRAFAGMVGYEYHVWYDTRRFCGRCGTRMVHDTVERMVRCPECGCMEFSRLFPAVIIGIVDRERDRVLVSRYANRAYKRYALIAGFCEMGETVEQTVHREVREEVGLAVKNLRYYASQPWPPSSSLLFGFFCDLDGEASITLDDHELEHAEWLPREDLPKDEAEYSLTRDMMRVLREGRETGYPVSS